MVDSEPSPRPPRDGESWPFSATLITSLAVAATVGAAMVIHVLLVAGGEVRTRLVAVLPIYFIATFALVFAAFWGIRALVVWAKQRFGDGVMGAREHGIAVLLTFVLVSLVQYSQGEGLRELYRAGGAAGVDTGLSAGELRDMDPDARLRAADSSALRPDAYAVLLRDRDLRVRLALTRRPELPAQLLDLLADDPAAAIRAAVAESPKTDDVTLRRLAYDREERVRLAVARNRDAGSGVLDVLAGGTAPVRAAVAANPRTARETLVLLARDEDPAVARVAQARLTAAAR